MIIVDIMIIWKVTTARITRKNGDHNNDGVDNNDNENNHGEDRGDIGDDKSRDGDNNDDDNNNKEANDNTINNTGNDNIRGGDLDKIYIVHSNGETRITKVYSNNASAKLQFFLEEISYDYILKHFVLENQNAILNFFGFSLFQYLFESHKLIVKHPNVSNS